MYAGLEARHYYNFSNNTFVTLSASLLRLYVTFHASLVSLSLVSLYIHL